MHFLGGLSRDPGSLVHRASATFARHGVRTLLNSKFVIGLDAVAAPLTGANRIGPMTFVLFDAVGALFWVHRLCSPRVRLQQSIGSRGPPSRTYGYSFGTGCRGKDRCLYGKEADSLGAFCAPVQVGPNHSGKAQRQAECRRGYSADRSARPDAPLCAGARSTGSAVNLRSHRRHRRQGAPGVHAACQSDSGSTRIAVAQRATKPLELHLCLPQIPDARQLASENRGLVVHRAQSNREA